MPGLDGWAVLTALKGNPDLADIPIIVVTITDDKNMGYALGAADYLTKPIEPARLTAILKKYTSPAQKASVLVVDDDPDMRDITARLLTKGGCDVQVAENGRVALDLLALHTPSLIVLDLMMPEVDGFDFLDRAAPPARVADDSGRRRDGQGDHRRRPPPAEWVGEGILQKRGSHRDDLLAAVEGSGDGKPPGAAVQVTPVSTILLVEDNEMNRDMLSRRLERARLPRDPRDGWPRAGLPPRVPRRPI